MILFFLSKRKKILFPNADKMFACPFVYPFVYPTAWIVRLPVVCNALIASYLEHPQTTRRYDILLYQRLYMQRRLERWILERRLIETSGLGRSYFEFIHFHAENHKVQQIRTALYKHMITTLLRWNADTVPDLVPRHVQELKSWRPSRLRKIVRQNRRNN